MHNFMTCCRAVCNRVALIRIWNSPHADPNYRDYCGVCAGLILEFNQEMVQQGEIELKWEKIKYAITDFFPGQLEDSDTHIYLYSNKGDSEYWTHKILLDGNWSEEDFYDVFQWQEVYRGAGCPFSARPIREFNGHSTLFTQSGGLDI